MVMPQTVNKKAPVTEPGLLPTPISHDQCAPTYLTVALFRRRNCRPREGGFTAICNYRNSVILQRCRAT